MVRVRQAATDKDNYFFHINMDKDDIIIDHYFYFLISK